MEGSKSKEIDAKRTVGCTNLQWPKKSDLNEKHYPVDFLKVFINQRNKFERKKKNCAR